MAVFGPHIADHVLVATVSMTGFRPETSTIQDDFLPNFWDEKLKIKFDVFHSSNRHLCWTWLNLNDRVPHAVGRKTIQVNSFLVFSVLLHNPSELKFQGTNW